MQADITAFQEQAAKSFIAYLKQNICSYFGAVSALIIFDPRKAQKVEAAELSTYSEEEISMLLEH